MEKLSFEEKDSAASAVQREELIRALKENPAVRYLFARNGIPEKYLLTSPWTIKAWLSDFEPCQKCPGLSSCGQKKKGYFNNLVYDGILQTVQTPCRYQKEKLRALAHTDRFLINDMPEKLKTVSFKTIKTDGESRNYIEILSQAMRLSSEGKSFYLCGTMGSGKTYLAACAANDHARSGEKVCFVHYPSFCRRMAASAADGEYRTEADRLKYCRFLVIDDIGAESMTEWNRDSILLPVLDARYEDGLATWFTSNCDYDSLKSHFAYSRSGKEESLKAARIVERIHAMCEVGTLTGKDRRNAL